MVVMEIIVVELQALMVMVVMMHTIVIMVLVVEVDFTQMVKEIANIQDMVMHL